MTLLTQLPGHICPGDHGGLRVVIGGIEHLVTANDAARLLYLVQKAEAVAVLEGRLDICMVVSV